jgi:hypothetical protein
MVIAILVVLNIAAAYLSCRAAESRGRSVKAWMWLGVLFGPFAWLAVVLLPPLPKAVPA